MVSPKRLVGVARKWRKLAEIGRRRISSAGSDSDALVASKGHFVVYTRDGQRFVVPLAYLNNSVFRELLEIAKEEFGLPRDQPIMLPCDAAFMECVVMLLRRRRFEVVRKALLDSIDAGRCSVSSLVSHGFCYQRSLHGF